MELAPGAVISENRWYQRARSKERGYKARGARTGAGDSGRGGTKCEPTPASATTKPRKGRINGALIWCGLAQIWLRSF